MSTAQQLYEGVDIGGGTVGLITYMRTDSTNACQRSAQEIRGYITKNFERRLPAEGADPVPQQVQERPGGARGDPADLDRAHAGPGAQYPDRGPGAALRDDLEAHAGLPDDARKFDTTSVDIWRPAQADNLFRASGQILVFPGFMAVYQEDADDTEQEGRRQAAAAGGKGNAFRSTASSASSISPSRRRATPKRVW